jgi:hypothetical protein
VPGLRVDCAVRQRLQLGEGDTLTDGIVDHNEADPCVGRVGRRVSARVDSVRTSSTLEWG